MEVVTDVKQKTSNLINGLSANMIHTYRCKKCKKKTEIDKPLAEQYRPTCCEQPMARVYYAPNIVSGCLNGGNIA